MNSIGLCKLRGVGGSTGLSKLSRGPWGEGGGGFDSFQAPIRRVIYVSTVIYY